MGRLMFRLYRNGGWLLAAVLYVLLWCCPAFGQAEWAVRDIEIHFEDFDQTSYAFRIVATYHQDGANAQQYVAYATIGENDSYTYSETQGAPSGQSTDLIWERAAKYGIDLFEGREVRCWAAEIRSMVYPPGLATPQGKQGFSELTDWVDEEQDPIDPEATPLEYEACPDCQTDDSYTDQTSSPYDLDDVLDTEMTESFVEPLQDLVDELGIPEDIGSSGFSFNWVVDVPGFQGASWNISTDPSSWTTAAAGAFVTAGEWLRLRIRNTILVVWVFLFVFKIIQQVRYFK